MIEFRLKLYFVEYAFTVHSGYVGAGQSFKMTKWQAVWYFSENLTNCEIFYHPNYYTLRGIYKFHVKHLVNAFSECWHFWDWVRSTDGPCSESTMWPAISNFSTNLQKLRESIKSKLLYVNEDLLSDLEEIYDTYKSQQCR